MTWPHPTGIHPDADLNEIAEPRIRNRVGLLVQVWCVQHNTNAISEYHQYPGFFL